MGAEDDAASQLTALRELRRVLVPTGRLLITVPCGEPESYGWFRQDDVRGWTRLFTRAGFFVEEQEVYELTEEGWRASPELTSEGLRYGERGPRGVRGAVRGALAETPAPAAHAERDRADGTPAGAALGAPDAWHPPIGVGPTQALVLVGR